MHISSRAISVVALAALATTTGLACAQAAAPAPAPSRTHPAALSGRRAVSLPATDLGHFTQLLHTKHTTRHGLGAASQTSTNWSGYAATGGSYTAVTSSWIEPSVSCTSNGIVAFWIGLDGWGSDTVEQGRAP